jgi:hypothetical protein
VNGPPWLTVAKDLGLYVVGIFGILYQLLTGHTDPLLLAVFTVMLGIPGATNIFWLLKQGGESPRQPSPSESSPERPTSSSGTG